MVFAKVTNYLILDPEISLAIDIMMAILLVKCPSDFIIVVYEFSFLF